MPRMAIVMAVMMAVVAGVPQIPLGEAAAAKCGGVEARNETLEELMEDYFQWKLRSYPEWATLEGFPGYNHLVEDFSLEGILKRGEQCQEFLHRSCLVEAEGARAAGHQDIMEEELGVCVEGMQYKGYLLPPINFLEGLQVEYPRLVRERERTPLGSIADYEDLLARVKLLPRMVGQVEELLREGVRQGVTYARESLTNVDQQFEALQVPANVSDFYVRFRDMPGSLGRHVVGRMQGEAHRVVGEELLPALRRLQDYLKYEYSAALRGAPGVSSMQGGKEFYTAVLKWHTSTDMTPQEVHDIGLEEVAAIRTSVDELLVELGAGNQTFQEFAALARADPGQQFGSREEALETYRGIIRDVMARLGDILPPDTLTGQTP